MTCGTATRLSCSPVACIRRSLRRDSVTRRWGSRLTCTATLPTRCKATLPLSLTRRCRLPKGGLRGQNSVDSNFGSNEPRDDLQGFELPQYFNHIRPRGGVVTQRSAKPFTPVQFRAWPPTNCAC